MSRPGFLRAALAAALASGACVLGASAQQARGIETAPLTQLNAWSVGALSRGQGGLSNGLWRGADSAAIGALLDRLPTTIDSPAALALTRRVLLTAGDAPGGDAALDAARKRFSALGRLGDADNLATMAAGAGAAVSDPAIAQYAAQAELARGRRADACTRGRQAVVDPPSGFLLRLRAYCAAAQGERAAADLALELARNANADDPWFRSALAGVGDGAPRSAAAARYDTSLNAAVSVAANLRPGATPLANASTLALVTLARAETAPQPVRAQAAALAFRRGAIGAVEARGILRQTPATVTAGLPAIAVALRRVEAQPTGPDAAAAIAGVLRQATTPADFYAAASFFRPDIATLAAAPDAAAALSFAQAALAAGDAPLAQTLLDAATQAGADPLGLARTRAALAVTLNNADPTVAARRIDAGGANAVFTARDLAVLAAAGAPLDAAARSYATAHPPQGGRAADQGLVIAMQAAAAQGATGETALIAAVLTAPGAAGLDAASLGDIVRALKTAGLDDSARAIVVEVLLTAPAA